MNVPLTLVAGYGRLVGRPRGVAHVYVGPLTPSGRWVPRAGRAVCGTRTRRLSLLELDGTALDPVGRRMCARCSTRLLSAARRVEQSYSRDFVLTKYHHLKVQHLAYANALATSVDETHRIGAVTLQILGPGNPRGDQTQRAIHDLHRQIVARRRLLVAANRTPEEIEAAEQRRAIDAHNDAVVRAARSRDVAVGRALDRRARGGYLMPAERELLGMTG